MPQTMEAIARLLFLPAGYPGWGW